MGSGTVKLFRIASEINIGKDAIVEYLQSKGFDIQNKPTATLDDKMVDVVMEKFKKEKRAAEIQREKIQKHKDILTDDKKVSVEKEEKAAAAHVEKPAVTHPAPHVDLPAPVEIVPEPVIVEKPITPVPAPVVAKEAGPKIEKSPAEAKVGDVISLDRKKKPEPAPIIRGEKAKEILKSKKTSQPEPVKQVDKTISHEKPKTVKVPDEPVKPVVEAVQVPVEPIIHEKVKPEVPKAVEKKIATEVSEVIETKEKVTVIPDDKIKETVAAVETEVTEQISTDDSQKDEIFTDENGEPLDKAGQERRREKRKKKKKPFQETEPGESPQLKGLTVLGKIDLRPPVQEKPSKPEKRIIRTESSKDADNKNIKFKKRRHKTGEASPDAPAPGTPRVIPGLIKEKDRIKMAADASTDTKSKFKDKEPLKAKETEKEDRKKRKRKKTIREMISQEEVDKAIKETLSGMDGSAFTSQRAKIRMKKRIEREVKELKIKEEADRESRILKLSEFVTTGDLANMMNINSSEIILKCMELGLMVTINQRLDKDTITLIADDYDFEVDFLDEKEIQFIEEDIDEEDTLVHRPPIVTIMGHVDHGKTSLLDYIRSANVVAGEAGGITQHIGAYKVLLEDDKSITFLDTPGHEAFTAMRARGAQVTDIVILVVAADDSVMPQTIEAISHAKAASVPIIVAINKMDKSDANPDRIRQQLADHSVLVEEWGGKFQAVEISAKKGTNVDKLMEKVLIEAEVLDLKANPDRNCRGIVIESNMKKGWGSTATVIVQKGTLNVGDSFVSGIHSGKVRALLNEREHKIDSTGPSSPVMVIGFDGLPEVGDTFMSTNTEGEAREIANERKQLRREQDMRKVRYITLDQISAQIQIGGVKELNLVIKGDVAGSVEALSDSLQKLSRDEVKVSILHKGVGPITETDVMLAAASNAVVLGFNVNPTGKARKAAENESVDIRHYDIIYDCINEIQLALEGLLTPDYKEEITSTVEVRKTFKVSKTGTIAGCIVKSGKITRNDKVRVLRDGLLEFEGTISSLKRGKDDVREVETGFECGIQLNGYNEIIEGDFIESFKLIEVKRKFK
ncbi:MAG: translation initiation factor IF-2 [Candidatus Kapabacteria bacterium]|nr:translation initiation factor IF-2 [Candidatus Kapabacteria bacterium]